MKIHVISPNEGQTVCLHTDMQTEFLLCNGNKGKNVSVDYLNLIKQREERTFPNPVTVKWYTESGNSENTFLHLCERDDFSEYKTYRAAFNEVQLVNLKLGQRYFWRVCEEENGKVSFSDVFSFVTSDKTPRWILAQGLGNIRDIGGWNGYNGKKVKQGLVFRGCEMEFHYTIEDSGRRVLAEELGIKTDLDLRGEAVGKIESSKIGESCNFALIPCAAYSDFLKDKETCKKIFTLFADESNYPFYIHCWGGADRTGTVIFLLSAILGVVCDDLFLDYELTSLSMWGERSSDSEQFRGFLSILDEYGTPESTVNDKCENFILSSGITPSEIEKMRKILLSQ